MDMPDLPKGSTADYLSLQYSHPKWLVLRLLDLIGPDETQEFLRLDNDAVPTCIQVNPLKTTAEDLERELRGDGVTVEPHPWLEGCLEITGTGDLRSLPAFREGRFLVQDAAARLAAMAASAAPGDRVLDVCAAPGGKTAQLINGGAEVISLDISETRLKKLRDNMARLQFSPPQTACADGADYLQNCKSGQFDAILLDAPCSATGTLRRHPELVHIKTVADVEKQTVLQRKLLDAVPPALKPGGFLVYCVCSIAKAEGEEQLKTFLETHAGFRLCPLAAKDICRCPGPDISEIFTPEGCIRTLPFHLADCGGLDSFFIAKLQKVA